MREPPTILAIDPATSTGFALGVAGTNPQLQTRRWEIPGDTIPERCGRARNYIESVLNIFEIDLVAIEESPNMGGRTTWATTKILQRLYGVFTGAACGRGIALLEVQPSTWRKTFLGAGNGNLERADAKRAALVQCRRLGWLPADDNAADAAGIWFHACAIVAPHLAQQTGPLFARGTA